MPRGCCKRFFDRIPEEVPVFTLVAYDKAAAASIRAWLDEAKKLGTNEFKLDVAAAHLRDFERFAKENPDKMKVPD